jgi:hypothetical protein
MSLAGFALSAGGEVIQQALISQFRMTYEISPITLVGGVAGNFPGSMLAIVQLLQANSFVGGILQAAQSLTFNDFVAHFQPMPGATLIDNQIGEYPFANQAVAANAIIAMPLKVSLMMVAPAPVLGGYSKKFAAFTSMQQTLRQHTLKGGLFTVATPSFTYQNCILRSLRDVSTQEGFQVQTRWQWDFEQPLVTQEQAQAAMNQLNQAITNGTQTVGDPPVTAATPGPASGIGQVISPGNAASSGATFPGVGNSLNQPIPANPTFTPDMGS